MKFKEYFKESDSGIFHVSSQLFDTWDISKIGSGISGLSFGYGFYFTDSMNEIRDYIDDLRYKDKDAYLYKVSLNGNICEWEEMNDLDCDKMSKYIGTDFILEPEGVANMSVGLYGGIVSWLLKKEVGLDYNDEIPREHLDISGSIDLDEVPNDILKEASSIMKDVLGYDGSVIHETSGDGSVYVVWNTSIIKNNNVKQVG